MDLMTVAVYTICNDLLIPIGHKEHSCMLLSNFSPLFLHILNGLIVKEMETNEVL